MVGTFLKHGFRTYANFIDNATPENMCTVITECTRAELIEFLSWNDPNGVYNDEQAEKEGFPTATIEDLQNMAFNQLF